MSRPSSGVDRPRRTAYAVLHAVTQRDAYANLALGEALDAQRLEGRDAAFVTELVAGSCRALGTYDAILGAASGREVAALQASVLDVLRLGTHQLLGMRVPAHAAISSSVDLAGAVVGRRVTGLVNAVLRKVAARSEEEWLAELSERLDERDALALCSRHPRWIVDAYHDALPAGEVADALAANNVAPQVCLAARPGLADTAALGGVPTPYSPVGVLWSGNPAHSPDVAAGRAGVQDEGSQLVALALARAQADAGPWLDLCAGPGGKAALLAGLAAQQGAWLLAAELQPHRARLVADALRGYQGRPFEPHVIVADGTRPPTRPGSFTRVMADVPCTGLGALRRRPEARWRRTASDLDTLGPLQRALLTSAAEQTRAGGVLAYVTCSPHPAETEDIVHHVLAQRDDLDVLDAPALLPEVRDARRGEWFLQLWTHRHGTDAMFLALLRRR